MSTCTHAMVEGVNAYLAKIGAVAWPDAKIASEVCFNISESLNGPDILPEGGLDKQSALLIADMLKTANDSFIKESGLTQEQANDYVTKTAAAADSLESYALDVAGNCMMKAAAETALLMEPGETGDNSLEAAAGAGDPLAALELKNRGGAGAYSIPQGGSTKMPEGGAVGMETRHPDAPDINAPANDLSQKKAHQLANLIGTLKEAAKNGGALKKLTEGMRNAKNSAGEAASKAKKEVPGFLAKHKLGLGAAAAGTAVAGGAAAVMHHRSKTKEASLKEAKANSKSVISRVMKNKTVKSIGDSMKEHATPLAAGGAGAAGVALGALAGRASKDNGDKYASFNDYDLVLRGFQKAASAQFLLDTMTEYKLASLEGLDPDQLRQLADYVEQHIQEQSSQLDMSQLDPQLLAMLKAHGQGDVDEEGGGEDPGAQGGGMPQGGMPPKMGSILDRVKAAMDPSGGSLTNSGGDNNLDNASKQDPVAELEKKNRPTGEYRAEQGHSAFPNEGQVGFSKVIDTSPEHPDNTVTRETKSAGLSDEDVEYIAQIEKMAMTYGPKLPATLSRNEKTAAYRALVGMPPRDRVAYIARINA